MLKEDIEALTGQVIMGDITPVIIQLLKDSPYKEDLLRYLPFCSDKQLIEKVKEGCKNVSNKKSNPTPVKKNNSGPSLEEWISGKGIDLSL